MFTLFSEKHFRKNKPHKNSSSHLISVDYKGSRNPLKLSLIKHKLEYIKRSLQLAEVYPFANIHYPASLLSIQNKLLHGQ